jgi:dolichyl-diphosphooligosaccharide--protein glycosyltransferase
MRGRWPVLAILVAAALLRIWVPWNQVFGGPRINFLEGDAWYHLRLVENQVRNFPHAIHFDPYASPTGRAVAVAPLFDTLISTAVALTRGAHAPEAYVARIAAMAPAIIGLLAVLGVIILGTLMLDRRAGLAAGLVAAVTPGHFLERTLIGYVDHHALEALLALGTMIALARCLPRPDRRPNELIIAGRVALPIAPPLAGIFLGLYLLTWGSGAYLVAILTFWIVLSSFVAGSGGRASEAAVAGRATAFAAVIALLMVGTLQDPSLYRFNTQIASLLALLVFSLLVIAVADRPPLRLPLFAGFAAITTIALVALSPDLIRGIAVDLGRFRSDATRMAVVETRPLFMYTGSWKWLQPWTLFSTNFYLGLSGLAWLFVDIRRTRRLDHLLVAIFTAVTCAATIGQNRFGYYLVPANAVVIGWLMARVLDRVAAKAAAPAGRLQLIVSLLRRPAAIVALFVAVAIAPSVRPALANASHRRGMPDHWADAMGWLRARTPEPFASDDHYFARYERNLPPASNTVMNWWDQGYWIMQAAHRVPVSDPTQDGAVAAARFYTATDEGTAAAVLTATHSRHVLADWQMPFRDSNPGALGGEFQSFLDWAGLPSSRFYALCFARLDQGQPLQPIWIFREAYYQTMAFRLMVLGGRAAPAAESAWLVQLANRRDAKGNAFCEITSAQAYRSADEAKTIAAQRGAGFEVVGLTPSRPAFPVAAVEGLHLVYEISRSGPPSRVPLVRIFEVTR